jgi:hypothetical protein
MWSSDQGMGEHAIHTLWQALQSSQSLPSIPLLDTDMEVIGLRPNVLSISERIAFVCKGICGAEFEWAVGQ